MDQDGGKFDLDAQALGMYVGTILIGFAIHALVSLPLTLLLLTRKNPFAIMKCARMSCPLLPTPCL
jgi:Na+/H+-dicarboxylate symporter